MKLLVNGNNLQVPGEVNTIADVITHFFAHDPIVIVEHNGVILDKSLHPEQIISDGDKIELVQFVGGG